VESAIEYVVEYNNGLTWEETMRTQDEEKARLHFKERSKNFTRSRWRLSKVQLLEFTDRRLS
jgi:hypothetical protein